MTFVWHDANDISEALRKRDEHERIKGEDTRNRNEAERISAENTRKTKEAERIMKENERQEYYSNTVIPLVGEVQQYEEVKDNVENAKTGFDGKEYLSLKHRLDADFTEIKEQFNANSYIPFEDEYVNIENSLNGVTKDMELNGRTLQNLYTENRIVENITFNATDLTVITSLSESGGMGLKNVTMFKQNVTYTMVCDIVTTDIIRGNNSAIYIECPIGYEDGTYIYPSKYLDGGAERIAFTFMATKPFIKLFPQIGGKNISGKIVSIKVMILQGDWTNKEIPSHFEGIKSVGEEEVNLLDESQILSAYIGGNDGRTFTLGSNTSTAVIPCEPNTTYTIVKEKVTDRYYAGTKDSPIVNGDKLTILPEGDSSKLSLTVTTPSNARYLAVYLTKNTSSEPVGRVGIYKSVSSFQWSPYNKAKISILSTGKNKVNYKDFNLKLLPTMPPDDKRNVFKDGYIEIRNTSGSFNPEVAKVYVKQNTNYYISTKNDNSNGGSLGNAKPLLSIYNSNLTLLKQNHGINTMPFNSGNNNFIYIGINISKTDQIPINEFMKVYDIALTEGTSIPPYESYKEDKKEILLNQPLRGLSNINDRIFERNEKVLLEQNIGKVVIDGRTTPSILDQFSNESTICFYISVQHSAYGLPQYPNKAWGEGNYVPISDKFIFNLNILSSESVQRSFGLINAQPNYVCFRVPKTEIGSDLSAESIRSYMQNNPVTIYYKLPIPIITELDISTIELRTLLGRTHIMSLNKIPSMLSFKAPVDVPATISTLKARNENLKQENEKLKENQIITTETLINILEPMMLPEDADIDDNYLFNRLVESLKRLKG